MGAATRPIHDNMVDSLLKEIFPAMGRVLPGFLDQACMMVKGTTATSGGNHYPPPSFR
jgi:hypothetical protein